MEGQVERVEKPVISVQQVSQRNTNRYSPPVCQCFVRSNLKSRNFKDSGAFYDHLGVAGSVEDLRILMERRCGVTGDAIRIETVDFCRRPDESGCPKAEQILRRQCDNEKFLVVAKNRTAHFCATRLMVIAVVDWNGVPKNLANYAYGRLSRLLGKYGEPVKRGCGKNAKRPCNCQGDLKFLP